ncbi:HD-GYP domain-containing protein [Chloroflexota bacterium]
MLPLSHQREKPKAEISSSQGELERKLEEKTREYKLLFFNTMDALIAALESKDKYTAGHSQRVSKIAVVIGEELGLSEDEIEELRWASLLHDIGKIAIDPSIQNKPGKLDAEEYIQMRNHVNVAPDIVKWLVSDDAVEIIRHHHDRYNGTGFEQTIRGEKIPLGARIIAVADSYDAMTSDRPYRKAMSVNEALAELERCNGSQFDPSVVRAFLKVVASESWDFVAGMV